MHTLYSILLPVTFFSVQDNVENMSCLLKPKYVLLLLYAMFNNPPLWHCKLINNLMKMLFNDKQF